MSNPAKYLSVEALARIDDLQLLAKTVVEGFILGLHRSPFHGSSVEFSEHRPYSPGDEIKHIDWRVYAKIDRYYIKQYEAETNLTCNILLDASASMGYKSDPAGLSKLEYGSSLAACLAYFMIGQRDATGLAIFDDEVRTVLPPRLSQSHMRHILSELDALQPGGETDVAGPMHVLADSQKRRGLMVVISDLLGDVEAIKSALQRFRFEGHDIIVFHIMDDAELTFPFSTMTQFEDLESRATTLVSPESTRTTYLRELRQFLTAVEKGCADVKADYKLFNTKTPLEVALSEYLYRRSQLG
jgi:uncharacterized protein (DUF58 family)